MIKIGIFIYSLVLRVYKAVLRGLVWLQHSCVSTANTDDPFFINGRYNDPTYENKTCAIKKIRT